VQHSADFQDHGSTVPSDHSASLQWLLNAMGVGRREALWAAQMIERKAAVARWRSGQSGKDEGCRLQCGKERRA
jgi:hypothetical protein